ncbi:MAG TPA: bifunctional adenosylcobinamide kinase/adenosylcobinamide-phosphate guanylyltransferase [Candidatus Omnitrophota bacterium]|nr:bifunctional adenosylcobinamide kinase/adenosylcobinamide-phosphate guanylyltransferase [Candidatus Omnitrophota bacterium]
MLILITGGVRSGKSRYALQLASGQTGRRTFIATAEALDDEMRERIRRHREERDGSFRTIEELFDLAGAVGRAGTDSEVIVIDCLTLWVSNLISHRRSSPEEIENSFAALLGVLKRTGKNVIAVTNEVGMGIIPVNPLAREYGDLLGGLNRRVAEIADQVILMVCGLPQQIKKGSHGKMD